MNESILDKIAARSFAYNVFHSLFGSKPTEEQMAIIAGDVTAEAFTIVGESADDEYAEVNQTFAARLDWVAQGGAEALDHVKDEYTRLLIGPRQLVAPPWESMYLSNDRRLFSRVTYEVRRAYRAQGFIPTEYPIVSDDHLALELDFMKRLAGKMQDLALADSADSAQGEIAALAQASRAFLDEHLLKWVPQYASDLASVKDALLYPQAAALLEVFLKADRSFLETLGT